MAEREIWKDIQGYEGIYQASNLGKIKTLDYRHTGKEALLKCWNTGSGYLMVSLWKNRKEKRYLVHRVIASTFLDNPNKFTQVNHRDENKHNIKQIISNGATRNIIQITGLEEKGELRTLIKRSLKRIFRGKKEVGRTESLYCNTICPDNL